MYQPYPSAGEVPPEPARPGPPRSVVMAVRLMWAGAVVSTLSLILTLVTIGSLRNNLHKARPSLTPTQLHDLQTFVLVGALVIGLISIVLWVWMALMNKAGKSWARIVATVLFVLWTLYLLLVAGAGGGGAVLVPILIWVIGVAATFFLWRKDSSRYFAPQGQPAR